VATEAHKAIVRRFFDQAVNRRQYDVIDELVASDFVLHSALLGEVHGGGAYKQSVLEARPRTGGQRLGRLGPSGG
jgi:hypothetical protein